MSRLEMKYFVLKPKGHSTYALASRIAMEAYAKAIEPLNPELAKSMLKWVRKEQKNATLPSIATTDYIR